MRVIFFDTETTGLPLWREPSHHPDQPHIVDLAAELWDLTAADGPALKRSMDRVINPGVPISAEVAAIHGITTEIAAAEGIAPKEALEEFLDLIREADLIVAHNIDFDARMIRIQSIRHLGTDFGFGVPAYCTMKRSTNICRILKANPRTRDDFKWPKLEEALRFFFNEEHEGAHRAMPDVRACRRVFFALLARGIQ